jgi:hypothetical protein
MLTQSDKMKPMDTKPKKKYEKPKITRIKLDAKTAVLSVCKTSGVFGPGKTGCLTFLGDDCIDMGS